MNKGVEHIFGFMISSMNNGLFIEMGYIQKKEKIY